MNLSPNFTFDELTRTATGLPNQPPWHVQLRLVLLAALLEEIRAVRGTPRSVRSGYRAPAVNKAVRGKPDSAHLRGEGADLPECDPEAYAHDLYAAWAAGRLPLLGKLIIESDHVHVQVQTSNAPAVWLIEKGDDYPAWAP